MDKRYDITGIFLLVGAMHLLAARPFVTDDPGTVPPAAFELETAVDYGRGQAASGLVFKHGVTDRMDIGIASSYTVKPIPEAGFGALEASLKYALVPGRFAATVNWSVSDDVYAVNLIFAQPVKIFRFDANCGLNIERGHSPATVTYSVAAHLLPGRIAVGIESGGAGGFPEWWQIGVQLPLASWIAIDLGLSGDFKKRPGFSAANGLWVAF